MLGCFTELIDAVILTGGLANSKKLTGMVIDYLHNLVKVVVIPGRTRWRLWLWGPCASSGGRRRSTPSHPACALVP